MNEYHKIQTILKRDPETKFKILIEGAYSMPEFEYLKNNKWEYTEKVNGTNIRIMYNGIGQIKFGGKTDNAQIPANLMNRLTEQFFPGNYRQDQGFVLFDIKIGDWWLQRIDVESISEKLGIAIVPIVGIGTLFDMMSMARKGFNPRWGNFEAEGIVARPVVELKARNGQWVIAKIKHKDFIVAP